MHGKLLRGFSLKLIVAAIVVLLLSAGASQAASVKLLWDANTESTLKGYKIYYKTGTSGPPYDAQESPITVPLTSLADPDNPEYTLANLSDGQTYYFAVTAYSDTAESAYSDEVVFSTPVDSDGDGIDGADEISIYGTDPDKYDTDGDGISDGAEVLYWGTAWDADPDADGLYNLIDPDSDNDGYTDGVEINGGSDPADPGIVPSETIYEDAEDGTTDGWDVYDSDPAGAQISNVYDAERQSNVIEFDGSGMANGYRLRNTDGSKWYNTSQFVISWGMSYSESFVVYIDVETTAGHRYLTYRPVDYDIPSNDNYVNHRLGLVARDGQWHTFVRDLQADLSEAQPGVIILEVNGFLIRGSGRVDDIKLLNEIPPLTYEDAEDGTTDGWDVYDSDPAGAQISNVYDAERQSNVIEFDGSGIANGYRLRNTDGSKWHNTSQFVISWGMSYSESFVVYIDVETTAGHRYLTYTPVDYDALGDDNYVFHGLGSDARDGQWHTFVRDLQADLNEAQPGVNILEVNGFFIRGSGRVDDIKLLLPS